MKKPTELEQLRKTVADAYAALEHVPSPDTTLANLIILELEGAFNAGVRKGMESQTDNV